MPLACRQGRERCSLFMKKTYYIILVLFISFSYSQETVKKKNRKTSEEFHVLKSNKKIKHGPYTKYFFRNEIHISGQYENDEKTGVWKYYHGNGKLSETGRFKNGVKDSIWTRYAFDGQTIGQIGFMDGKKNGKWEFYYSDTKNQRSVGNYEIGNKVGVWEYYNKHGVLIHKFDHSTKKLIYYTNDEDALTKQPNELDSDPDNQNPMILGGNQNLKEHLKLEWEYPQEAQWNGISASVYVLFDVDENFEMKNFFVQGNPGYGIGKEVIRLVKTGPTWLPKKVNGNYETSRGRVPFTFTIQ